MNETMKTFGAQMVGITFNPSGDDKINQIKQKMAEVIDILIESNPDSEIKTGLFQMALHDILQAQMISVKLLTFKD